MATDPTSPPAPRRALRVGVVGHRELSRANEVALRAVLSRILAEIRDAMAGVGEATGLDTAAPPRPIVVSALAAGADQIVAEEALALGYELHAPLPFLAEEYAADFAADPEAARRYDELRRRASHVFELGAPRSGPGPDASRAYLAVGRVVLANADLLLAVWDREPSRGSGGTADVVLEAIAGRLPVVVVPPGAPEQASLRVCVQQGPACESNLAAIPGLVRRVLRPFDTSAPHGRELAPKDREVLAIQEQNYRAFLAEPDPQRIDAIHSLRALLVYAWRGFVRLVTGAPTLRPAAAEDAAAPDPIAPHAQRADLLARHYLHLYRGAFLVNFLLGATAVTMALWSLLSQDPSSHGPGRSVAPVVEIIALSTILVIYARARTGRWHRRGIDYRVLAELFRQQRHLAPLGLTVPSTRPRAHAGGGADLSLAWTVAHARAVERERGLRSARFTPEAGQAAGDRLGRGWLDEQAAYHQRLSHVLERGECRLERTGLLLFVGAAIACLLHFLAPDAWHPLLAALAAGLPAWAAALHGILALAEWPRLAERSEGMARRLRELSARIQAAPLGAHTWRDLADLAQQASQEMLHELDDWQVLTRAGDVPAP